MTAWKPNYKDRKKIILFTFNCWQNGISVLDLFALCKCLFAECFPKSRPIWRMTKKNHNDFLIPLEHKEKWMNCTVEMLSAMETN